MARGQRKGQKSGQSSRGKQGKSKSSEGLTDKLFGGY